MSLIIGVTGRARSGKGTVAEGLAKEAKEHQLSVAIYEISEYVLMEVHNKGLLPKSVKRELCGPAELEVLVKYGEQMRKQYHGHWTDQILVDLEADRPDVAILPNIRFLDEAAWVRAYGYPGKIIRVKTFVKDGIEFISQDRDPNHPMEIENIQVEADYFLTVRKGQPELLKQQARSLFCYILNEANN